MSMISSGITIDQLEELVFAKDRVSALNATRFSSHQRSELFTLFEQVLAQEEKTTPRLLESNQGSPTSLLLRSILLALDDPKITPAAAGALMEKLLSTMTQADSRLYGNLNTAERAAVIAAIQIPESDSAATGDDKPAVNGTDLPSPSPTPPSNFNTSTVSPLPLYAEAVRNFKTVYAARKKALQDAQKKDPKNINPEQHSLNSVVPPLAGFATSFYPLALLSSQGIVSERDAVNLAKDMFWGSNLAPYPKFVSLLSSILEQDSSARGKHLITDARYHDFHVSDLYSGHIPADTFFNRKCGSQLTSAQVSELISKGSYEDLHPFVVFRQLSLFVPVEAELEAEGPTTTRSNERLPADFLFSPTVDGAYALATEYAQSVSRKHKNLGYVAEHVELASLIRLHRQNKINWDLFLTWLSHKRMRLLTASSSTNFSVDKSEEKDIVLDRDGSYDSYRDMVDLFQQIGSSNKTRAFNPIETIPTEFIPDRHSDIYFSMIDSYIADLIRQGVARVQSRAHVGHSTSAEDDDEISYSRFCDIPLYPRSHYKAMKKAFYRESLDSAVATVAMQHYPLDPSNKYAPLPLPTGVPEIDAGTPADPSSFSPSADTRRRTTGWNKVLTLFRPKVAGTGAGAGQDTSDLARARSVFQNLYNSCPTTPLLEWAANKSYFTIAETPTLNLTVRTGTNIATTNTNFTSKIAAGTPGVVTIRLYNVDVPAYFALHGTSPDSSMDIDGYFPHFESSIDLSAAPASALVRVAVPLPALDQCPGTFLVEASLGGISVRAMITKGALRLVSKPTDKGIAVAVVRSGDGSIVKGARITLAPGLSYTTDTTSGVCLLPFVAPKIGILPIKSPRTPSRSSPSSPSIERATGNVLLETPDQVDNGQEKNKDACDATERALGYAVCGVVPYPSPVSALGRDPSTPTPYVLECPAFVNREELVPGRNGSLLLRPLLSVYGQPVTLTSTGARLTKAVLTITGRLSSGLEVSSVDEKFLTKLEKAGNSAASPDNVIVEHIFRVPEDLTTIETRLEIELRDPASGALVELNSFASFYTMPPEQVSENVSFHTYIRNSAENTPEFVLVALDKAGNPIPSADLSITLAGHTTLLPSFPAQHVDSYHLRPFVSRDFRTNNRGEIILGAMNGVTAIKVSMLSMGKTVMAMIPLPANAVRRMERMTLPMGLPLTLPFGLPICPPLAAELVTLQGVRTSLAPMRTARAKGTVEFTSKSSLAPHQELLLGILSDSISITTQRSGFATEEVLTSYPSARVVVNPTSQQLTISGLPPGTYRIRFFDPSVMSINIISLKVLAVNTAADYVLSTFIRGRSALFPTSLLPGKSGIESVPGTGSIGDVTLNLTPSGGLSVTVNTKPTSTSTTLMSDEEGVEGAEGEDIETSMAASTLTTNTSSANTNTNTNTNTPSDVMMCILSTFIPSPDAIAQLCGMNEVFLRSTVSEGENCSHTDSKIPTVIRNALGLMATSVASSEARDKLRNLSAPVSLVPPETALHGQRVVGSEARYVLSRRSGTGEDGAPASRVGLFLGRPSLLLHRRLIGPTVFDDEEELDKDTAIGKAVMKKKMHMDHHDVAKLEMEECAMSDRRSRRNFSSIGGHGAPHVSRASYLSEREMAPTFVTQPPLRMDFLAASSKVLFLRNTGSPTEAVYHTNVSPSTIRLASGIMTVSATSATPIMPYRVATLVYISAAGHCAVKFVPVPVAQDTPLALRSLCRDISSTTPAPEGHGLVQDDTVEFLTASSSATGVSGSSSAPSTTVSRLSDVLSLVRSVGHHAVRTGISRLSIFLGPGWKKLSLSDRMMRLSEFGCHEVHFFLACSDPAFFTTHVLPCIQTKSRKEIVDLFLLGDDKAIRRIYGHLHVLPLLNALELTLLVIALAVGEKQNVETKNTRSIITAQSVLEHLIRQTDPLSPSSQNENFDRLLNLRALVPLRSSVDDDEDDVSFDVDGDDGDEGKDDDDNDSESSDDDKKEKRKKEISYDEEEESSMAETDYDDDNDDNDGYVAPKGTAFGSAQVGMASRNMISPPPPPPAPMPLAMARGGGGDMKRSMALPMKSKAMAAPVMAMSLSYAAAPSSLLRSSLQMAGLSDDASAPISPPGGPDLTSLALEQGEKALPKPLFSAPEATKEYEERGYYNTSSSKITATTSLISPSMFWVSLATAVLSGIVSNENENTDLVSLLRVSLPISTLKLALLGFLDTATRHEGFNSTFFALGYFSLTMAKQRGGSKTKGRRLSHNFSYIFKRSLHLVPLGTTLGSNAPSNFASSTTPVVGTLSLVPALSAKRSFQLDDPYASSSIAPSTTTTLEYGKVYKSNTVIINTSEKPLDIGLVIPSLPGAVLLSRDQCPLDKGTAITISPYSVRSFVSTFLFLQRGTIDLTPISIYGSASLIPGTKDTSGSSNAFAATQRSQNSGNTLLCISDKLVLHVLSREEISSSEDAATAWSWEKTLLQGSNSQVLSYLRRHKIVRDPIKAIPVPYVASTTAVDSVKGNEVLMPLALTDILRPLLHYRLVRCPTFLLRFTDVLRELGYYQERVWRMVLNTAYSSLVEKYSTEEAPLGPRVPPQTLLDVSLTIIQDLLHLSPHVFRLSRDVIATSVSRSDAQKGTSAIFTGTDSLGYLRSRRGRILCDDASVIQKSLNHSELLPLLNSRAHALSLGASAPTPFGDSSKAPRRGKILNKTLRLQWEMALRSSLVRATNIEKLPLTRLFSLAYYLILQERDAEAARVYSIIREKANAMRDTDNYDEETAWDGDIPVQLDYLKVYMSLLSLSHSASAESVPVIEESANDKEAFAEAVSPSTIAPRSDMDKDLDTMLGLPIKPSVIISRTLPLLEITEKYTAYPIKFWRDLFNDAKNYVTEATRPFLALQELQAAMAASEAALSSPDAVLIGASGEEEAADAAEREFARKTAAIHDAKKNDSHAILTSREKREELNAFTEDNERARQARLTALASAEPYLGLSVERGRPLTSSTPTKSTGVSMQAVSDSEALVKITHSNLEQCVLTFHKVDIEMLFSLKKLPGAMDSDDSKDIGESASKQHKDLIAPIRALHLALHNEQALRTVGGPNATTEDNGDGTYTTSLVLPKDLFQTTSGNSSSTNANIVVGVSAPGVQSPPKITYCPSALRVQVKRNAGQLTVALQIAVRGSGTDTRTKLQTVPLPGVYIKCLGKMDNGVTDFYKDGYTDLRGCFDYASLSNEKLKSVREFSILIISEKYGAIVEHTKPPVSDK